jgi:TPR repeat protein
MNSIRLDDDSARHCAKLRDSFKESYVNEVKNYFSSTKEEIDWSAIVLAQMQVLLDTINLKNIDKSEARIVLNAFFASTADFNVEMEIMGLAIEADQDSVSALLRLANLYDEGIKTKRNLYKSIQYLERAIELDSSIAMNRLGIIYADGIVVEKNLKKAFKYFKSSAELGDMYGQYNVGKFYEKFDFPDFTDDDFLIDELTHTRKTVLSRLWINLAAEQGLASAQHDIAWGYHMDEIHGIDYKLALFWYRLAASQGFLDSINNLGELFLNGQGVVADHIEAYKWFHIASVNNDADALDSLAALEKTLSPSEIQNALTRKQNWLSIHPVATKNIYGK